jgi:hypothetical protein
MMRLQVYALSPLNFFFFFNIFCNFYFIIMIIIIIFNAYNYFETDTGPNFLKHETVSYSCKAGLLNFQNTKRETFLLEEKAMEVIKFPVSSQ